MESIHRDYEKARKVYRSTCDDYGYAKSCLKYANYTFVGRGKSGSKPNPTEALEYYEKGCKLNDGDNCLHAGRYFSLIRWIYLFILSKDIKFFVKKTKKNKKSKKISIV